MLGTCPGFGVQPAEPPGEGKEWFSPDSDATIFDMIERTVAAFERESSERINSVCNERRQMLLANPQHPDVDGYAADLVRAEPQAPFALISVPNRIFVDFAMPTYTEDPKRAMTREGDRIFVPRNAIDSRSGRCTGIWLSVEACTIHELLHICGDANPDGDIRHTRTATSAICDLLAPAARSHHERDEAGRQAISHLDRLASEPVRLPTPADVMARFAALTLFDGWLTNGNHTSRDLTERPKETFARMRVEAVAALDDLQRAVAAGRFRRGLGRRHEPGFPRTLALKVELEDAMREPKWRDAVIAELLPEDRLILARVTYDWIRPKLAVFLGLLRRAQRKHGTVERITLCSRSLRIIAGGARDTRCDGNHPWLGSRARTRGLSSEEGLRLQGHAQGSRAPRPGRICGRCHPRRTVARHAIPSSHRVAPPMTASGAPCSLDDSFGHGEPQPPSVA